MQTFKWTIEFEVSELWVADGFEFTDERAEEMLLLDLRNASHGEVSAKVIKSPSQAKILKTQGYNAAHIAAARRASIDDPMRDHHGENK